MPLSQGKNSLIMVGYVGLVVYVKNRNSDYMNDKILAFEYLVTQMMKWNGSETSSFTRLKALKLLFFVATVKDEFGHDLLDVFDNFYALPNGPVESDVYNCITADRLSYYSFMSFSVSSKKTYDEDGIKPKLKEKLDLSLNRLLSINPSIFKYSAEDLVALSHYWTVWKNSITIANIFGKGSYKMSTALIRKSEPYYSL